MLNVTIPRQRIVAAARGWLGTPYHHQASLRGVGSDCLGLIRGIWRELYGEQPEATPPYTMDWGSATGSETLLAAALRHLVKLEDVKAAAPGDVLVFRMRDSGVAKHAGFLPLMVRGPAVILRSERSEPRRTAGHLTMTWRPLSRRRRGSAWSSSRLSALGRLRQGLSHAILGVSAALSIVAMWAVGDMSLTDLIAKLPAVPGGLGLAALGAKVDAKAPAEPKEK